MRKKQSAIQLVAACQQEISLTKEKCDTTTSVRRSRQFVINPNIHHVYILQSCSGKHTYLDTTRQYNSLAKVLKLEVGCAVNQSL
jgi:hypothetical protein